GRPMWGTFWVWDARLPSVFILFFIYLGALRFQKLTVEPAPISICVGPIDIPIIKSLANWWNTLHQPGSISQFGTSIHVPIPITILSNFAKFPLSTPQTERDVIKLMVDAIENIKPICEVEKVGVTGTIYDAPEIVERDRQRTLAIRWILEAAFK
ncbi:hypothetical protein RYX36_021616, partial [Vicia faba]